MTNKLNVLFAIIAVFVISGCGAGGDPSFSPDPSVEELFDDGESDEAGSGGSDAAEEENAANEEEEKDCFLDGFCYQECISASECPDGFSCIMGVCTFDCQSDEECGVGGICSSVGLCEVSSGDGLPACTADADCGEGRFCNVHSECEQIPVLLGCQGDADCPLGQYCDETHQCEIFPGPGVECVQDCRSDFQCLVGEGCSSEGRCVIPGVPAKLVSFSFSALGSDSDPSGSVVFESANFKLSNVQITPAGRDQVLGSPNFRLTGSFNY